MDKSSLDALVKKYEYKSPSYDLKTRPPRQVSSEPARFKRGEDGIWRPKSNSGEGDTVSILIAGDLLCQENMIAAYRKQDGSGYDFNPCFDYIRPLLQSADLVIGNLETPVSETAPYRGEILTHEGPFFCNAPLEYLAALRNAGFDVVTLANNHILDAGLRGLVETADNCDRFGLIHTGVVSGNGERCEVVEINGIKIGLAALASSYNSMEWNLSRQGRLKFLNTYSERRAQSLYRALRDKGAEYTIVMPHWGREYTSVINSKQRRMADKFVDIGYNLIAGSHSHVVQKFNRIAGVPVIFSLGNLISHINTLPKEKRDERYPILCHVTLSRGDNGRVKAQLGLIPCCIIKETGYAPFAVIPSGVEGDFPEEVSQKLHYATRRITERLNSDEEILEMGGGSLESITLSFSLENVEGYDALPSSHKNSTQRDTSTPQKLDVSRLSDTSDILNDDTHMINQVGCVLKVFNDHAEHVGIMGERSIVRCPKEVEGIPVTKTALRSENKTGVRIVYTSSNTVSIEEGTFASYPNLESVRLFKGLKQIKNASFSSCPKLTGIILPESLELIGEDCFAHCEQLQSVKIPPHVREIGKGSFEGCPKLVIYCEKDSFAQSFAQKHGFAYKCMPLTESARSAQNQKSQAAKKVAKGLKEAHPLASGTKKPVMGPMNKPDDLPPTTILAACEILGTPLPTDAQCGKQPSYYLGANRFSGTLYELKSILGSRFPDVPEKEIKRRHRLFRSTFQTQKCLQYTDTDFTIYFTDWLLFARDRGFSHEDYFNYELYNKEPDIRDTFLNVGYIRRVYKVCAEKESRSIISNKALFNKKFSRYVHRDWIDASTCTYEEFAAFASRHERFFSKPLEGTGGAGSHIVRSDVCSLQNLYTSCKENQVICEEIVSQHPSLASINSSTLNTVRVTTLLDAKNVPHIVLATARFGRAGKSADNFHSGGVGAVVDIDSGLITSEAINKAHERSPFHPDSGVQILGFHYPCWSEIKEAVCSAACAIPEVRNIGWDVAITEHGEVEFIEGNSRPGFDVMQSPDQIGKKYRYEPYLPALEKLKGVETPQYPALEIQLQNKYERNKSTNQKTNKKLPAKKAVKRIAKKATRLIKGKK